MFKHSDPLGFAAAIDEAKAIVVAALAHVDRDVAIIALAQLAKQRAAEPEAEFTAKVVVPVTVRGPRAPTAKAARKPKGKGARGEKTLVMLDYLSKHPRAPLHDVAEAVYGSRDRKSQNNLRSLLDQQKKAGRLRNVDVGEWEVIPE